MPRLSFALPLSVIFAVGYLAASAAEPVDMNQRAGERKAPKPVEKPMRYGSVIGLRAEKLAEYKRLHAAVWPAVAKKITEVNIRNYSIYLRKLPDGNYYLFSYFEYVGHDFAADMAKIAADPNTQQWWKLCDPCQRPLTDRKQGEWWASMEELFHQD